MEGESKDVLRRLRLLQEPDCPIEPPVSSDPS